jgi:hypothetical protein
LKDAWLKKGPLLLEKVIRIFSKLNEFQPAYEAVKRWQLPIQHAAQLMEPCDDQTSESVRFEMEHLLKWMEQTYTKTGDDVMVNNFRSYTKGFWKGLFTYYDAPHVPRTNNDHERFFRQTKTRHRRMTGRRSWNEYILRGGEFVVFVDDALQQTDLIQRLRQVDYETFCQERANWSDRLLESTKRKRFRRNPSDYLKKIEEKLCSLIGQS